MIRECSISPTDQHRSPMFLTHLRVHTLVFTHTPVFTQFTHTPVFTQFTQFTHTGVHTVHRCSHTPVFTQFTDVHTHRCSHSSHTPVFTQFTQFTHTGVHTVHTHTPVFTQFTHTPVFTQFTHTASIISTTESSYFLCIIIDAPCSEEKKTVTVYIQSLLVKWHKQRNKVSSQLGM